MMLSFIGFPFNGTEAEAEGMEIPFVGICLCVFKEQHYPVDLIKI